MKSRNLFFLFIIIVSGIFLRAFKIDTNYYFSGELGKELLYIRGFVVTHSIPLVGMTTSHEWLSYGPIYYWIMIPIFMIFSGNPFILFFVALTVSVLGLILNYFVVNKIAGEKIAIFSTLIQSLSPILIWQTRLSKLHVFFWTLMPLFMLLSYFLWDGKRKWILPIGLLFGVLFSFHFSQIPILGVVVLIFWIKRNVYKFKDWLIFASGVLIPNITLIWQDRNLALWLPYRIANITDKNPAGTLNSLIEYFGKNIFWDNRLWILGLLIFVVLFVNYVFKNKKNLTKEFLPFYLITSISVMLIANVLHGAPPIHYFLPIFTTVPILFATYFTKLKYWPFITVAILLINIISFTKDPYFYKNFTGLLKNSDFVSYSSQNTIAKHIVTDSKGGPLMLSRVGMYDYFPENYSQNYKYLVLWHGGNLQDNAENYYIIAEDSEKGEVSVQK